MQKKLSVPHLVRLPTIELTVGQQLLFGIDELMDMARTTTNVVGNAMAACVIARSEKEFDNKAAEND